jgi:hypothetical protein
MAVSSSLAAARPTGSGRLAVWVEDARQDGVETLQGGRRIAAMGVLLVTWGLFVAPPATALLVITGVLR